MEREPDLEIAAAVSGAELRFEGKPQVRVVVQADAPAFTESVSQRKNLPETLESGVTYTNFGLHWRVAARLEDPGSCGES